MTYTPPAGLVERAGRMMFDRAIGPQHWDNAFYQEERAGCLASAHEILAASGLGEALTALRAILDVDRYHRHMDNCAVCRPFNEARALLARLDPHNE